MAAGADVIEIREIGDLLQMGESAGVNDGHADVVDPLVADKIVRVPDGVEDFADSDGGGVAGSDDLAAISHFGGGWIFEPEKMKWFEFFPETRSFNGSEAMVAVVEQVQIVAEGFADACEELGHVTKIGFSGPFVFRGQAAFGGLIFAGTFGDAVRGGEAGDTTLHANGLVAEVAMAGDVFEGVIDIFAGGVAVDEHAFTAFAAEQVIDGSVESLAFDVPKRDVDGGDGGHGDGAATPVSSTIKILPYIFGLRGIAADDAGDNMVVQI